MCQQSEGPDWLMLMGIFISDRMGSIILAIVVAILLWYLLPGMAVIKG